MASDNDEFLPPHTVAGHITEMVRLAEQLAVDNRVGVPPERMVTSVVGLRDFVFRLMGHLECQMRVPGRPAQRPFGFVSAGNRNDSLRIPE